MVPNNSSAMGCPGGRRRSWEIRPHPPIFLTKNKFWYMHLLQAVLMLTRTLPSNDPKEVLLHLPSQTRFNFNFFDKQVMELYNPNRRSTHIIYSNPLRSGPLINIITYYNKQVGWTNPAWKYQEMVHLLQTKDIYYLGWKIF